MSFRALSTLPKVDEHPDTASAIPLQPSLAPVFVAQPPIPVVSTGLSEPPALIPALKIVKRTCPDTKAIPKTAVLPVAAASVVDSVSSPEPPAPVNSGAVRAASALAPSAGRYVTEGPGPWRVPIPGSNKERVAATARNHKPTPGTTLSGPRRIPLPSQAPTPAPAPAPPKALPQVAQAPGGPGLKRPLRAVPPNGSASSLPRAVGGIGNSGGSRLPMPKSKIAGPSGATGLPRRRVA